VRIERCIIKGATWLAGGLGKRKWRAHETPPECPCSDSRTWFMVRYG
jgi:hypothetical protein